MTGDADNAKYSRMSPHASSSASAGGVGLSNHEKDGRRCASYAVGGAACWRARGGRGGRARRVDEEGRERRWASAGDGASRRLVGGSDSRGGRHRVAPERRAIGGKVKARAVARGEAASLLLLLLLRRREREPARRRRRRRRRRIKRTVGGDLVAAQRRRRRRRRWREEPRADRRSGNACWDDLAVLEPAEVRLVFFVSRLDARRASARLAHAEPLLQERQQLLELLAPDAELFPELLAEPGPRPGLGDEGGALPRGDDELGRALLVDGAEEERANVGLKERVQEVGEAVVVGELDGGGERDPARAHATE